jgi:hydroxymethylbilane synthase
MERIIIGTRGSKLALWQTNWVKERLEAAHHGLDVKIRVITTTGDRITDVSLPALGAKGKGVFTRELEEEMLDGRIDIAVHSLKDLPTLIPPGLKIGAVSEREDVRDALVSKTAASFAELPAGATVGTSSLRRQAQLLAARPDLRLVPVRGNVDTRLRKVAAGEYDAVVLASAGLRRLGYDDRITEYLNEQLMLPAVGQGALAVESRADDSATSSIIEVLEHTPTRIACDAERSLLECLGGGCLVPIAGLALVEGDLLSLTGLVAAPNGSEIIRGIERGRVTETAETGRRLARSLLSRGADRLLAP